MNRNYTHNSIGIIPEVINVALAALPFVVQSFAHPARDEKNRIENLKKQVGSLDATGRLRFVIENSAQTTAPDVTAREWFLWYRKNYGQDYQILSYDDKVAFNDFMAQFGNRFAANVDTLQSCKLAMFNDTELNYNRPQNVLSNLTSPANQKYLIIGAIGLGLLLLLRK